MPLHVTATHVSFRLTVISEEVGMAKKVLSNQFRKPRGAPTWWVPGWAGHLRPGLYY